MDVEEEVQVHVFFSCYCILHALLNVQAVGPQPKGRSAEYVGSGKLAAVVILQHQEAMNAVWSAYWQKLVTLDPMKRFNPLHGSLASEAMVLVCTSPQQKWAAGIISRLPLAPGATIYVMLPM